MDQSEYENIARLESVHWWYKGMAAISDGLLARCKPMSRQASQVLDAGCGPGGLLGRFSPLEQSFGLDLHPSAVAYAHKQHEGRSPVIQGSVTALPLPKAQFDLVVSFDVLYHRAVPDDTLAFAEFQRVLKPGGLLLIRLPALEALRGAHDVIVHTRHRYERQELASKLVQAGFQIRRLTYANTFLFPFILVSRLFSRPGGHATSDVAQPPMAINKLLESVLRLEAWILKYVDFPVGVSLFAVAAKPSSQSPTGL